MRNRPMTSVPSPSTRKKQPAPDLIFALITAPGVFVPADADQAAKAEADIAALRTDLQTALLEPLRDLVGKKEQALLRRVERIRKGVIAGRGNWPVLSDPAPASEDPTCAWRPKLLA